MATLQNIIQNVNAYFTKMYHFLIHSNGTVSWLELLKIIQLFVFLNIIRANQAPSFSTVGENLTISSGRGNDYQFLFQLWHDERHNYTYNTGSCDTGAVCGHYTQVVNTLL